MTKQAIAATSRAEDTVYRRMYEYYVQIPESFYKQTYLELIRWLLDRVEPAHTVGIPVARASLNTGSSEYNALRLGPVPAEDVSVFEELASLTERDLVGLPGYPGLTPIGMWMPTNNPDVDDLWGTSFCDIPTPSVLFPCDETGSPLWDQISKEVTLVESESLATYRKHCSGLLAGDKVSFLGEPSAAMNIRRGVELTAVDQRFSTTTTGPSDPALIFDLGNDTPAAFLIAFRVTALPPTPSVGSSVSGILFRAENSVTNSYYMLGLDDQGALRLVVGSGATEIVSLPVEMGVRTGEWVCALAVIKPSNPAEPSPPNGQLKLYVAGQEPVDVSGVNWSMTAVPTTLTTFALGDPAGAASALAHTAYLAAWMGPNAINMGEKELRRFWTALNEAYVLGFGITTEEEHADDQVSWPVGGSPDELAAGIGILAAKYNRGQFPYAALGRVYDGEGMVRDVRGFGCNRQIHNLALASEDLSNPIWTIATGGEISEDSPVPSPEDLTNATRIDWTATSQVSAACVLSGPLQVAVSCWVRVQTGPDSGCVLFLRDGMSADMAPVSGFTAEHSIDGKWKRIVTVFEVPESTTTATAGVARTVHSDDALWDLWGFQFLAEPALSPYTPNHRTGTGDVSIAPASLLRFDEDRFPGFQDRGFVSFRVKPEELLRYMPLDEPRILLDAYTYDPDDPMHPLVGRAFAEILRTDSEDDIGVVLRLRFAFQIHPDQEDAWTDDVHIDLIIENEMGEAIPGWYDPSIEHRIAVAWDLARPVARTRRHIALWVDGVLATDYSTDEPDDPMDRSILLRHLAIGASYAHFVETLTPDQLQPCAVFREVELLSRHHPGLFTPTRLEVREAEEAGESV